MRGYVLAAAVLVATAVYAHINRYEYLDKAIRMDQWTGDFETLYEHEGAMRWATPAEQRLAAKEEQAERSEEMARRKKILDEQLPYPDGFFSELSDQERDEFIDKREKLEREIFGNNLRAW